MSQLLQWLTGSDSIPPLGLPKKISISFVHGCPQGCQCRPTASTCDLLMKIPVHMKSEEDMKVLIMSAVKDSYGFGLL